MKKLWFAGFAAVMGALVIPARAAESPIASFISPQTNVVIRLDLTQVDMDAVSAFVQKQEEASTPKDDADPKAAARAAHEKKDMDKGLAKAKKWVTDFQTAGGKDIYVVVELGGIFQGMPGEMVVPVDNAASPEALEKLLNPNPPPSNPDGPPPMSQPTTAVIGNAVVYSTGAMLQKLKSAPVTPPQAHIDLVDALASDTSGATLQIAGSPASIKNNPMLGIMIGGMTGMHPAPGPNGEPPAPPLSEPEWSNVTWVLLSVTSPPKESARFICQCKDADSATALAKLLTTKMKQGFDTHQNKDVDPADREKLKAALKPVADGSQVKISLDQDTLDNVFIPIMVKARQKEMAKMKAHPPVQQQPMPGNDGMPPDGSGNNNGL